jgi:hypothetical protein
MKKIILLTITIYFILGVSFCFADIIDFDDYTIKSYGGNQDQATPADVDIKENGLRLDLTGNTWKAIEYGVTVTDSNLFSFEFQSTDESEINAIGFAKSINDIATGHTSFEILGTQGRSTSWEPLYPQQQAYSIGDAWKKYLIDLSEFFSIGTEFKYLTFINDNDDSNVTGNSMFRNVSIVPVPGAIWFLGIGLLGLMGYRRKQG